MNIFIITKIAQFTGQAQGRKSSKKEFKVKFILIDLTFVIDRMARKPN